MGWEAYLACGDVPVRGATYTRAECIFCGADVVCGIRGVMSPGGQTQRGAGPAAHMGRCVIERPGRRAALPRPENCGVIEFAMH